MRWMLIVGAGVALSVAVGGAEARTVKVFNPTQRAIVAVQAKKPDAKEWEPDMLRNKALGVGKIADVDFGDSTDCVWDVRATLDDGRKVEKKNVDICKTNVYPFTDNQ